MSIYLKIPTCWYIFRWFDVRCSVGGLFLFCLLVGVLLIKKWDILGPFFLWKLRELWKSWYFFMNWWNLIKVKLFKKRLKWLKKYLTVQNLSLKTTFTTAIWSIMTYVKDLIRLLLFLELLAKFIKHVTRILVENQFKSHFKS